MGKNFFLTKIHFNGLYFFAIIGVWETTTTIRKRSLLILKFHIITMLHNAIGLGSMPHERIIANDRFLVRQYSVAA
jgi:hypothetical protein